MLKYTNGALRITAHPSATRVIPYGKVMCVEWFDSGVFDVISEGRVVSTTKEAKTAEILSLAENDFLITKGEEYAVRFAYQQPDGYWNEAGQEITLKGRGKSSHKAVQTKAEKMLSKVFGAEGFRIIQVTYV